MKHLKIVLALVGAMCLVLSGCSPASTGSGGSPAAGADWVAGATEALKTQAAKLVSEMEANNFASTHAAFGTEMSAAMTEKQLAEVWHATADPLGTFVKIKGVSVSAGEGYAIVVVVAEHAQGNVAVQLSFSSDQKIVGLYLRLASAADLAQLGGSAAPVVTGSHSVDHPVVVGPHQLNGTLVTPVAAAKKTVVVLVAGSGPNDMDETVGPNKPLRDIADGLAAHGISSLRWNKRYQQVPTADSGKWTLESEVLDDLAAALELLGGRSETAGYSIVVAGHSLGGMLLPTILARHRGIAAGISLAGTPRDIFDVMAEQLAARTAASDLSDSEKATMQAITSDEIAKAKALTDPNGPPALNLPASYIVSLHQMHARLPQDIAAIQVPVLVLQGGADAQVNPDKDYPAWRTALAGKQVDYQLFAGLNHLFMPIAQTQGPLDYQTPNHVDAQVVTAMADWLAKLG